MVIAVCALCAAAAPLVKPHFDRLFPRTNIPLRLLYELISTWLRSMVGLGFLMAGYELMRLFHKLDGYALSMKKRILCVCAGFCGLALTACLSLYNGLTDMHFMVFHHLWLYYLNALLGIAAR